MIIQINYFSANEKNKKPKLYRKFKAKNNETRQMIFKEFTVTQIKVKNVPKVDVYMHTELLAKYNTRKEKKIAVYCMREM